MIGDKLSLKDASREGYMEELKVRREQTINKPSDSFTVLMLMLQGWLQGREKLTWSKDIVADMPPGYGSITIIIMQPQKWKH